MIMTTTSNRKTALLNAIHEANGWIDRAKIAARTGKSDLSPNDVNHLRNLEDEGKIERRVVPGSGIREKFEYRALADSA